MPDHSPPPTLRKQPCHSEPVNELAERLAELQQLIEANREPAGPIRLALLPSLRASIDVISALIEDGQADVAAEVLLPVAKEVDRIIKRGY